MIDARRSTTRLAALAALAVATAAPLAAVAATAPVSDTDRAFVAKVSQGGMYEVAAGTLAATRGSTQDVRDLGTTEMHDHTLVGGALVAVIGPLGLPHSPTLNATFRAKMDALRALSGTAFDDAFVASMVDIHNKDGAAFAAEASGGTNPGLRAFATTTHRIVVRHLGALHATP